MITTGTAITLTLSLTHHTHLSFITAPGPPQTLKVVNITCHSITFQWSRPDDTGNLDITGYDILNNGASVANITGTEYTLKGLTPDTMQTIRVRTRNAIGPSVLERTLTRATQRRGEWKWPPHTYALQCSRCVAIKWIKGNLLKCCLCSSRKCKSSLSVFAQPNTEPQWSSGNLQVLAECRQAGVIECQCEQ